MDNKYIIEKKIKVNEEIRGLMNRSFEGRLLNKTHSIKLEKMAQYVRAGELKVGTESKS